MAATWAMMFGSAIMAASFSSNSAMAQSSLWESSGDNVARMAA